MIPWLPVILFSIIGILLIWIYRQKTLVAICCIDPRANELNTCLAYLKKYQWLYPYPILGVFREKDTQCATLINDYGETYITVPDYTEPSQLNKRHNFKDGLVHQRNKAMDYARSQGFTRIVFIDSDIRIHVATLFYVCFGTLFADVCVIPYRIPWADMRPMLGYNYPPRISYEPGVFLPYHRCWVAGMGCTCISLKSLLIPRFVYGKAFGIDGEDIGFFLKANEMGTRVWAANWCLVNHEVSLRDQIKESSVYKRVFNDLNIPFKEYS